MRRGRQPGRAAVEPLRSGINVTPLVDVCLVLLIIFMVVTPLIREGVPVTLPEAASAAPLPDRSDDIVISVRSDRSVWIGEQVVASSALASALGRLRASSSTARVLVRGDRSLPYDAVRLVFRQLTEAGFTEAGLATLREPAPGAR